MIKIGDKFTLLTVIKRLRPNRSHTYFECRCVCGITVEVRDDYLTSRKRLSCSTRSHIPRQHIEWARERSRQRGGNKKWQRANARLNTFFASGKTP